MTSTERPVFAEARREQERALPAGRVLVSCSAPLGQGGLGRHLQEILDALGRRGSQAACIDGREVQGTAPGGPDARVQLLAAAPLARVSPAWRAWRASVAFDARAARSLPAADHLIAFNGQALAQMRAARRAGWESLSLMSANSHMRHVMRQHARALRRHPIERSWTGRMLARNLAEYARADRVFVASRYAWESFVAEGFPEDRLARFPLTPAPRFDGVADRVGPDRAGSDRAGSERVGSNRAGPEHAGSERVGPGATFDVVYVGALTVAKGVPLLIEAVQQLSHSDLRLLLVGGAATRGMRRFLAQARSRDPRIELCPGDPLPRLRRAAVCVHPSYEEGFGYAPAEALACGVPVIVSADTGMKELIQDGARGLVLPTGGRRALSEAIDCAYRGEILGG